MQWPKTVPWERESKLFVYSIQHGGKGRGQSILYFMLLPLVSRSMDGPHAQAYSPAWRAPEQETERVAKVCFSAHSTAVASHPCIQPSNESI